MTFETEARIWDDDSILRDCSICRKSDSQILILVKTCSEKRYDIKMSAGGVIWTTDLTTNFWSFKFFEHRVLPPAGSNRLKYFYKKLQRQRLECVCIWERSKCIPFQALYEVENMRISF